MIFDSTYRNLHEKYGSNYIVEAGYFEKPHPSIGSAEIEKTLGFRYTPFSFLDLSQKNPAVLLMTGAFAPFHQGHLESLIAAKKALEKNGYSVAGAYLAPDHQEYIDRKFENGKNYPITRRIAKIEELIKDYSWIATDPWNAVFTGSSLNFTTVQERLSRYLHAQLKIEIPVFFVCGSDNARFSLTYRDSGHCVVLLRPGYEAEFSKYQAMFSENNRIIFDDSPITSISSTSVRAGGSSPFTPPRKKLILRVEKPEYLAALKHLEEFGNFSSIQINHLADQHKEIDRLLPDPEKTISLDSQIKLQNNLRVSRVFDFFGSKSLGYSVSHHNLENLISGETYDLYDDDISSGKTIEYVKNLLAERKIKVRAVYSLTRSCDLETEILDARDFFIDERHLGNGLMIQHHNSVKNIDGNGLARQIYAYPYVCPSIRASIDKPLAFSAAIWKMNYEMTRWAQAGWFAEYFAKLEEKEL